MKNKVLDFLKFPRIARFVLPVCMAATIFACNNNDADTPPQTAPHPHSHAVFPATTGRPTVLIRDTVNINRMECKRKKSIRGGTYYFHKNIAYSHHLRDTLPATADDNDTTYAARMNKTFKYNDYHEIRHARNFYYMGRVAEPDINLFINNEFWARVAEGLAQACNMPPIAAQYVDPDINYPRDEYWMQRTPTGYFSARTPTECRDNYVEYWGVDADPAVMIPLQKAFDFAIDGMTTMFDRYMEIDFRQYNPDDFRRSAAEDPDRQLSQAQALDSMRVFRIDGETVDVLKLADWKSKKNVAKFFNEFVPARLAEHGVKTR